MVDASRARDSVSFASRVVGARLRPVGRREGRLHRRRPSSSSGIDLSASRSVEALRDSRRLLRRPGRIETAQRRRAGVARDVRQLGHRRSSVDRLGSTRAHAGRRHAEPTSGGSTISKPSRIRLSGRCSIRTACAGSTTPTCSRTISRAADYAKGSARPATDVDPAVGHGELDGRDADGAQRGDTVVAMDRGSAERESAPGHARRLRARRRRRRRRPSARRRFATSGFGTSLPPGRRSTVSELSSIRARRDGASLLVPRVSAPEPPEVLRVTYARSGRHRPAIVGSSGNVGNLR